MGFGVYTRTNDSRVSRFSTILGSYLYSTLSLALIASGGIVIFLSFLGCCGAIKEVRCMLGSVGGLCSSGLSDTVNWCRFDACAVYTIQPIQYNNTLLVLRKGNTEFPS